MSTSARAGYRLGCDTCNQPFWNWLASRDWTMGKNWFGGDWVDGVRGWGGVVARGVIAVMGFVASVFAGFFNFFG